MAYRATGMFYCALGDIIVLRSRSFRKGSFLLAYYAAAIYNCEGELLCNGTSPSFYHILIVSSNFARRKRHREMASPTGRLERLSYQIMIHSTALSSATGAGINNADYNLSVVYMTKNT
jgi:hypothetical protein